MNDGAFQVEYFCTQSGLSANNDGNNWFCQNPDGTVNFVLSVSNYDRICRDTYNRGDAFAIQDGPSSTPAFRWRCYAFN